MNFDAIQASVFQLVGSPEKSVMDFADITHQILTEIDLINQELINSSKGRADYRYTYAAPAAKTGSITGDATEAGEIEMVFELLDSGEESRIDIAADYEDLLRKESTGVKAIYFTGGLQSGAARAYRLSWTPTASFTFVLISKKLIVNITDLTEWASALEIPSVFSGLIVHRAALALLPRLFLPHVQMDYTRFVSGQSQIINRKLEDLEHIWKVFRTAETAGKTAFRTNEYDPMSDFYGV